MDIIDLDNTTHDMTLVLPISKNELGNFIYGLLGQQQSIERELSVNFDIDHDWIINLHELISQRIHMQASAKLVSFSSVIYFQNGLKRTFTSVDAFKGYSETKRILPIGIKIIWNFLVQFPNSEFPEKQQITFSAVTEDTERGKPDRGRVDNVESLITRKYIYDYERSTIRFQIDHTERTWGDDLEVIIFNHVGEIIRADAKLDALFQLSRLLIFLFILIGGTIYSFVSGINEANLQINKELANYENLKSNSDISLGLINEKIDTFVNLFARHYMRTAGLGTFLLGMSASMILAITVIMLTRKRTHSFLVLTKEAVQYRAQKLKTERRSNIALAMSFILSVLAGIVANYGYIWLVN